MALLAADTSTREEVEIHDPMSAADVAEGGFRTARAATCNRTGGPLGDRWDRRTEVVGIYFEAAFDYSSHLARAAHPSGALPYAVLSFDLASRPSNKGLHNL